MARAVQGRWLVRIEDTDLPRNQPGATESILNTLTVFGLIPDGPILRQQDRTSLYEAAIQSLAERDLVYGCACTRSQLAGRAVYPGTCAHKKLPLDGHVVRLRVPDQTLAFVDRIQGLQTENLAQSRGDLVLRRRDGIISYQLAVVCDDAAQGVTEVVRGADLLDQTLGQRWLGRCLNFPEMQYAHLPLAMNAQGQKLSKQNLAQPLDDGQAAVLLGRALEALGQGVPVTNDLSTMLDYAVSHWQTGNIPHKVCLPNTYR